jgi:hypothetical protein
VVRPTERVSLRHGVRCPFLGVKRISRRHAASFFAMCHVFFKWPSHLPYENPKKQLGQLIASPCDSLKLLFIRLPSIVPVAKFAMHQCGSLLSNRTNRLTIDAPLNAQGANMCRSRWLNTNSKRCYSETTPAFVDAAPISYPFIIVPRPSQFSCKYASHDFNGAAPRSTKGYLPSLIAEIGSPFPFRH